MGYYSCLFLQNIVAVVAGHPGQICQIVEVDELGQPVGLTANVNLVSVL